MNETKTYEIHYQKLDEAKATMFMDNENMTVESIKETHVRVAVITAEDLEDVFFKMNDPYGEGLNPLATPAGQELIKSRGVYHTSMSVNDVVFDLSNGKIFRCAGCGWKEVE